MELKQHANQIRKNIINMLYESKSGHPGGSLSATDILTCLYFEEMNISDENIDSINRDRFVLSKGHAAPALYATLLEKGFCEESVLTDLRKVNSPYQGHPNMNYVKGIDMSTGSLGQGVSCAVGMAISNKLKQNDYRIYTLLGDGECQEGLVWEAAMAATHYKLDNLCVIVDCNHLQIDGQVETVMNPYPLQEKFAAFGFETICVDGHDHEAILDALKQARMVQGKPTVILAETIKGKGVSFMENQASWHGVAPSSEEREAALKELGE